MEEKVYQGYLYDFYGELLNEHQRRIFEDYVLNDYSLTEIAEQEGISRQGVSDMVKRCNKTLVSYEERLHLLKKFMDIKVKIKQMEDMTMVADGKSYPLVMDRIRTNLKDILEEL